RVDRTLAALQLRRSDALRGGGVMKSAIEHQDPLDVRGAGGDDERPVSHQATEEEVTLLELLDRVLDKGVVLSGDITLSVADVDLVYVGLRVLLSSVETANRLQLPRESGSP